jgi:hypothetical protein
MTIHRLPNAHLALTCDTPGCTIEGPMRQGVTEDELLDLAEEQGWNIERELGLHYCPVTTVHDCSVCGAPTRSSITDVATGEVTYYCDKHWPDFRSA